jgi:hypothetical protein
MSLFRTEAEPEVTGIDVLRKTLAARMSQGALALIASNIPGTGVSALEDWVRGGKTPPPAVLSLLAKELYGGHVELSETGMLRSANKQAPVSMGIQPPQWNSAEHPPVPINRGGHAPFAPVKGVPPQSARPKRPGWAD